MKATRFGRVILPDTLKSRTVQVNGKTMHYAATADLSEDRPAVVLVHGVGLSHRYMIPTAELMVDDFRVYVPDLPGFGKSYKPKQVLDMDGLGDGLAGWMGAVGLEEAGLLGNSVGCQIIVRLALRHPDRVRCAVLQGPTVDAGARTWREQVRRWHQNGQMEEREKKGTIVLRDYWECGLYRIYRTFAYAMEDEVEERLPQMRCPTLVVRGERDPIVSQEWAEEVTRLLPQGRLVVLSGNVSHTLNYEAPEELVRVATPFLAA